MERKEKIEEVETAIEQSRAVLEQERPCRACAFRNEDCTWCMENKIPISNYMRGCRKFITDEEAIRKVALAEYESHQKALTRLLLKMDIMAYLINGASIELEKIDKELEDSYNAVRVKDDETIKNHRERKRNRDRLHKAYKSMKFSMQDIRNTFDTYVEHYFTTIFSEEDGSYNFKEADKNLVNSGVVTSFVRLFVDRTLENGENADAIMQFLLGLKGSGILNESDFGECMIRK